MFSLRPRTRQAWTKKLNDLNSGHGTISAVFAGRAQFRWAQEVFIALGVVFALIVVLLLATGTLFLPGGLLLIYIAQSLRPPRTVGVSDGEVVVASRSFVNSKPKTIVARAALRSVAHDRAKRTLTIGDEVITFTPKEHDLVVSSLGSFAAV